MRGIVFFLIAFFCASNAFGQTECRINNFPDGFYVKLIINPNQDNEVFKIGKFIVFNKSDNSQILTVESDAIIIPENLQSKELDFGKQSNILYEDFNFDGKNDLAIQTDYSSKGPSYSIYLQDKRQFKFDDKFTEIIQKSQGEYSLDPSTKTIETRGDGGCCWHSYSTFTVKEGKPFPTVEIIEELDSPFTITTTKSWTNGKVNEKTEKTIDLDQEGIYLIMSFKLLNKNKKVVIYNISNRTVNYALIAENNKVEFDYPIETEYKNPDFLLSKSGNELSFKNKDASYKVYQTLKSNKIKSIGIIVTLNGQVYDLKGDINSLKGNLNNVPVLDNVLKK